MQRHFSNRGEALAEVAAAKVMAVRQPPLKSGFPPGSGKRSTLGLWQPQAGEGIRPASPKKKKQPGARSKAGSRPPESGWLEL
jgi:hypothetical protein